MWFPLIAILNSGSSANQRLYESREMRSQRSDLINNTSVFDSRIVFVIRADRIVRFNLWSAKEFSSTRTVPSNYTVLFTGKSGHGLRSRQVPPFRLIPVIDGKKFRTLYLNQVNLTNAKDAQSRRVFYLNRVNLTPAIDTQTRRSSHLNQVNLTPVKDIQSRRTTYLYTFRFIGARDIQSMRTTYLYTFRLIGATCEQSRRASYLNQINLTPAKVFKPVRATRFAYV